MLHPDLVEGDQPIPPEGAIDEAVETAKAFCGAEAPGFVNGILAAALREVRENGARACLTRPASTSSSTRLEHAAARAARRRPGAERAAALVDECARLAAEAGAELDRRVRAAATAPASAAPARRT